VWKNYGSNYRRWEIRPLLLKMAVDLDLLVCRRLTSGGGKSRSVMRRRKRLLVFFGRGTHSSHASVIKIKPFRNKRQKKQYLRGESKAKLASCPMTRGLQPGMKKKFFLSPTRKEGASRETKKKLGQAEIIEGSTRKNIKSSVIAEESIRLLQGSSCRSETASGAGERMRGRDSSPLK